MLPSCRSPGVVGTALSPTTANVVIRPPSGGPWESYELTLCPVGGPATRCIAVTCPTTSCPVTGLTPGTSYVVQASLELVWSRGVIGLAVRCCMPCVALLAGCLAQCSAAVEAAGCGCQTTAGCICRMLTQRLLHCCAALLAALCRLLLKRMTAPRAHPPTKTSSPCPCGPRPH